MRDLHPAHTARSCFLRYATPPAPSLPAAPGPGNPVKPREWFLAPLDTIDDAVGKIRKGTIAHYVYDPDSASLVRKP